jgi:predicted DNA-binding antitoxin AbrB/MazE fold protein
MAQVISAIYENGVLKPLETIDLKEHSKVYITIEIEEERKKKVGEILALIRKSREGLSEEELSIIESSRLDKTLFFPERMELK